MVMVSSDINFHYGANCCLYISGFIEKMSAVIIANDAECGKEIDDCSISKIGIEETTDMKLQDTGETEEQSTNMLKKESKPVIDEETTDMKTIQSWTG